MSQVNKSFLGTPSALVKWRELTAYHQILDQLIKILKRNFLFI